MNHYQFPSKKFQFTNKDGVNITFTGEELPKDVYSSAHFAHMFQDENMERISYIFPITPVEPFTAETLPTSSKLASTINIQDVILLMTVHNVSEIKVFNATTGETFNPDFVDVGDDRTVLMVGGDKSLDASQILKVLESSLSMEDVIDRFDNDDSRNSIGDTALNDWVDFRENIESRIYTFTEYSIVDGVLTLTTTEQYKV